MNETSACNKFEIHFSSLNSRQLAVPTLFNLIVMTRNVSSNILVIYILYKTKQIANVTFKLIFMLSTLYVLTGVFVQNLFLLASYEKDCLIQRPYRTLSTFFVHLSGYVIAVLDIDRHIRIKYHTKSKSVWTTKVVITLLFIECLVAIFQTVMLEVGLYCSRGQIGLIVYDVIDVIISMIMFLQIQTFRALYALRSALSVRSVARGTKIVTKLSVRITFMLYLFAAPHVIVMNYLRRVILDNFVGNEISIFEFIYSLSIIFVDVNSPANALLFLTTNLKRKRFLRT